MDGWEISEKASNKNAWEEFLYDLRNAYSPVSDRDFADDEHAREIVTEFFNALKQYLSEGELNDLRAQLPPVIAEVIA